MNKISILFSFTFCSLKFPLVHDNWEEKCDFVLVCFVLFCWDQWWTEHFLMEILVESSERASERTSERASVCAVWLTCSWALTYRIKVSFHWNVNGVKVFILWSTTSISYVFSQLARIPKFRFWISAESEMEIYGVKLFQWI